jgi:hypothetical protein
MLASHLRRGTEYTFATMSDTFDPYCSSHRHQQTAIGKDSETLSLIDREMPATKSPLPAT